MVGHASSFAQMKEPFHFEIAQEVDVAEIIHRVPYKCSPLEKKEFLAAKGLEIWTKENIHL